MSALVDSLNLRPQEKRIIVVIAVVVFVVLNLFLVFPRFKDYGKIQAQLGATRQTIAKYNAFIAQDTNAVNGLKVQLQQLEKQPEGVVVFKEIQLQQTVMVQARASGVFIKSASSVSSTRIGPDSQSDRFFESQSIRITVEAAEDSLVKFLYDVGNDPAMIRVRELALNPLDNNRFKLNAAITLTADYQKTAAPKPVTTKPVTTKPVTTKTDTTPKPAAPTPQAPGARRTPTNSNLSSAPPAPGTRSTPPNVNPAPARRGAAPPALPPMPGQSAGPPAPGRTAGPPAPGQSAMPPVPTRPARPAGN